MGRLDVMLFYKSFFCIIYYSKLHDLKPGDWIVVRDLRKKSWRSQRWNGPQQVLLTTETAMKVAERATWIHASHCKFHSQQEDNALYYTVLNTTRRITNESCYVCAQLLHGVGTALPIKPQ